MAATTQLIHDLLAAVVEKSRTAREEQERVEKELAEASAREAAERAAILDAALQKETKARREAAMAISATSLKQIRAAVMRPTRPLWPVWSMRSTPNRLPQEAAERPLGQKLWRELGCALAHGPAHRIATVTGVTSDSSHRLTCLWSNRMSIVWSRESMPSCLPGA
jgi:hypothetical protein